MLTANVSGFEYSEFLFEIYNFEHLAQEVIMSNCPEKVFVVIEGSVIIVDNLDNRNEFTKEQGFELKNQNNYIIRSSSDITKLLSIKKK